MSYSIQKLIDDNVAYYFEYKATDLVKSVIDQIESSPLREPQINALKVYLWIKFYAENKTIFDMVNDDLLFINLEIPELSSVSDCPSHIKFLFLFFQQYKTDFLPMLAVTKTSHSEKWKDCLKQILQHYGYPNFIYSLPMGAGKTYLMACFIYLDLYFSHIFPNDKRFAHNFIVLAPHASKTAILPSLLTIQEFDPTWIIPEETVRQLKLNIKFEILDSLSSKRKSKLHGSNPNLEIVNRTMATSKDDVIFITNAEKVVMDNDDGKLRKALAKIKNLGVFLDEAHHTYSVKTHEKKIREAIDAINEDGNVCNVLGFTGTPYVTTNFKFENLNGKTEMLQDVVYYYPLPQGIKKFLKIPIIEESNANDEAIIINALNQFYKDFDKTYKDGTVSKIAFYCKNIKSLNEDVFPIIMDWYATNRPDKANEILIFHNDVPKNKVYFDNLDEPSSPHRVILLVAIGKEGWDCKSLTGVVLPRLETTPNFVLQTTCRCLREVDDAQSEKALIYLYKDNCDRLKAELKKNYKCDSIDQLKGVYKNEINAKVRKSLGVFKYQNVLRDYNLSVCKTVDHDIDWFVFMKDLKEKYPCNPSEKEYTYKGNDLTVDKNTPLLWRGEKPSFIEFIYQLTQALYGHKSESDLIKDKSLTLIYKLFIDNFEHFKFNSRCKIDCFYRHVASNLVNSCEYHEEKISRKAFCKLLEWDIDHPATIKLDRVSKFIPAFKKNEFEKYNADPELMEKEFFSDKRLDPHDISFNYIPYRMANNEEILIFNSVLTLEELKDYEFYYNGYKNKNLSYFRINTPYGIYTPDFLILKRKNNEKDSEIEKVIILELRGIHLENTQKTDFVKNEFLAHNQHCRFQVLHTHNHKDDINVNLGKVRELIKQELS